MKWLIKPLPWFLVALFGADIVTVLAPKKDGRGSRPAERRLTVNSDACDCVIMQRREGVPAAADVHRDLTPPV